MSDPKTLNAWYDLLKKVFADLRGAAHSAELARRENYKLLFEDLRVVHKAYVALFVAFRNALMAGSDPESMDQAKERFMEQRSDATEERTVLQLEAKALARSDLPEVELDFLAAVANYLFVQDSPSGHLESMSGLFWIHIQNETEVGVLWRDTDKALEAISASYNRLVARYAALDPAFRLDGANS